MNTQRDPGYNTGKVIIGSNYTRPLRRLNSDERIMQSMLLGFRSKPQERLLSAILKVAKSFIR